VRDWCNVFDSPYSEPCPRYRPDCRLGPWTRRSRAGPSHGSDLNVDRVYPLCLCYVRSRGRTSHRGIRRGFEPVSLHMPPSRGERDRLCSRKVSYVNDSVVVTGVDVHDSPAILRDFLFRSQLSSLPLGHRGRCLCFCSCGRDFRCPFLLFLAFYTGFGLRGRNTFALPFRR